MARGSTVSVLQKKEKSQQVTFRLSATAATDLSNLEKRIETEAPDQEFNRNAIVENALREAIKEANSSLDALKGAAS
jgi:hypothetical protein